MVVVKYFSHQSSIYATIDSINVLQANAEKLRLETKQRAARKAADQGVPIKPRWFRQNNVPIGQGLAFEYSGGYWESRDKGKFEGCRDIFGA